jgi:ABC-type bacteriocin/lantibiotic exporter with double-glycine peptidase domain
MHIIRINSANQGAISINDNSFKKINLNQFRSQIEYHMEKLHLKGLCLKILLLKNATVSEETLKWAIEGMQLKEFKVSYRKVSTLFSRRKTVVIV